MKDDMYHCDDEQQNRYATLDDEALIRLAHTGDLCAEELLYEKYKHFVRSKARSYFLIGADREDIIQEGMIGLYKAIRDYNQGKNKSFRAFAELCITRQMITAVKSATRQKHIPLNCYISLNKRINDDDEAGRTLIDVLSTARVSDPEQTVIVREEYESIALEIDKLLTPLERKVLSLYLRGEPYVQIAKKLNRQVKSIDNALQRVKKKIDKMFETDREHSFS